MRGRLDGIGSRMEGQDGPLLQRPASDTGVVDEMGPHRLAFFRRVLFGTPLIVVAMASGFLLSGAGFHAVIFPALYAGIVAALGLAFGRTELLNRVVYNLFGLATVAVLVAGAYTVGGGMGGPELVALPLLPVLMSFLGGRRVAAFWTGAATLALVALTLAAEAVPPSAFQGRERDITHLGSYAGALTVSLLVGLAWMGSVRAQARALARSRDEARAASAAKSAFLATMSHEIRTPLAAILGITELLESTRLTPEQQKEVHLLRGTADALNALIGDVLDIARIEAGRLSLRPAPVELTRLTREVGALFSARARNRGLALELATPDVPVWVALDGMRLRQVLINLVSNSVKFTDVGVVRVRVSVEGDEATFAVEDTGPGIPLSQRAALFESFTQGESSHSRHHEGSGLGLAIASQLCTLLGGRLELESEVGRGSKFHFRLPLTRCEAPAGVAVAARPTGPVHVRVLLVEDNLVNQMVFSALLESRGCAVRVAGGGAEGVEAALADPPDLVLMDIQMPEVDGLEATRRLRAAGYRLPIYALTANALPEDRTAAEEAGMDGFLTKPLSGDAMREVLERVAVRQ